MGTTLKPNLYLTNLSIAHFQEDEVYAARKVFPVVQVGLKSANYLIFDKGDLARDDMRDKPLFGKVQPALLGQGESVYSCKEKQILVGIDAIGANNTQRMNVPGVADPRRAKTRVVAEKVNIHLDSLFAKNFFQKGVWTNELKGTADGAGDNEFVQFDNGNSNPIELIDKLKRQIQVNGRRKPNKLTLGTDVFDALKRHPIILERIKYTGTTANPAVVTEKVLAEMFGIEEVKVLEATYNAAAPGEPVNMQFIGDPKSALLSYAPANPQIDEPSAGYIFMWDMGLGGNLYYVNNFEGEDGTHTEYIEGLISVDMKKTGDDLAVFLTDVVA